jgi:hypothetical protein
MCNSVYSSLGGTAWGGGGLGAQFTKVGAPQPRHKSSFHEEDEDEVGAALMSREEGSVHWQGWIGRLRTAIFFFVFFFSKIQTRDCEQVALIVLMQPRGSDQ